MQTIPVPDYLVDQAKAASGLRSGTKAVRHALERMVRDYQRDDAPPTDESIQLARKVFPQTGTGKARSLFA